MKKHKLFLALLVASMGLSTACGVTGCSKAAIGGVTSLLDTTAQTAAAPQRVAVDRGAFKSRVRVTLRGIQGGQAELALADGRGVQVPTALLPAGATAGSAYVLAMTLAEAGAATARIDQLDPTGQARLAASQGAVSLPASLLPTQARQQGGLILSLYDNPRPAQALSFDARVTGVAAEVVALRGEDGAAFELPRTVIRAADLKSGDTLRVTISSTNEPDDDWSGTVAGRDKDSLVLVLNSAARQVRLPGSYAPQATQTGDFFALTLVKVTYQAGDLTQGN